MKTVAIYGHKFADTFLYFRKFSMGMTNQYAMSSHRWGGIYNVVRALSDIQNSDITTELVYDPDAICGATFLIHDNSITTIPDWEKSEKLEPRKADWHHIAYIDRLDELDEYFFKSLRGTISVDLADKIIDPLRVEMLSKYVDYWFQSIYNFTITDNINSKCIVLKHSPQECLVFKDGKVRNVISAYDKSIVNTVGAGDYFAGHFIGQSLLHPNIDLHTQVFLAALGTKHTLRLHDVKI